jgi:hypothetical protein
MTLNMAHVKAHVFLKHTIVTAESSYMQAPLMFSKIQNFLFNFLITHTYHIFSQRNILLVTQVLKQMMSAATEQ